MANDPRDEYVAELEERVEILEDQLISLGSQLTESEEACDWHRKLKKRLDDNRPTLLFLPGTPLKHKTWMILKSVFFGMIASGIMTVLMIAMVGGIYPSIIFLFGGSSWGLISVGIFGSELEKYRQSCGGR